jgi:hypothetical protein
MSTDQSIDMRSDEFAHRFADLLVARRTEAGVSRRSLARSSGGAFTARVLRDVERAQLVLTEDLAGSVAMLYGLDMGALVPARSPLRISGGSISAAGTSVEFIADDATSLLVAYLSLVGRLRNGDHPAAIDLRRSDVELLADHLDVAPDDVIDRFAVVTGARSFERKAMAGMFAGGGEVVGVTGTVRSEF